MLDIFDFWSRINPDQCIHPDDAPVFERVGKGHGFKLECLPAPMRGRLKTARVVLLFLSPGYEEQRDLGDAKSKKEQDRYVRTRTGLEPYSAATPGYLWFRSRVRFLEEADVPADSIDENVAVLNIGAYHSKNFTDYPLLAALPSSRVSLNWAQSILFPQAVKGEKVVICLRSAHFWGLERGQSWGNLFAPIATRGGHMMKSGGQYKNMHKKIVDSVKVVLSGI